MHHNNLFIQYPYQITALNSQSKWNYQFPNDLRVHRFLQWHFIFSNNFNMVKINLNGFLESWPELTVGQVNKYNPNSEATVKGHLHAHWSNIDSNKKSLFRNNMNNAFQKYNTINITPQNE